MAGSKKEFNLNDPKDIEEIQKILWEDEDEPEDFGDSSDTDSEAAVEEFLENSESEQDADTDQSEEEVESFFVGKDKKTKWNRCPPSSRIRGKPHNIIKKLPGVIGVAKSAQSPLECWNLLVTDGILDIIVTYTNQYIDNIQSLFQRERDAKHIDIIELKAFIGLLFLAGVHRGNRQSLEDLWGSEGDGIEKFRLVMNLKRFKFIMRCLRFDNKLTRQERKQEDKLAPIREIFTMFVENCQKHYYMGENVTIDEKLEGFRGRCSFKQYIPSKPNKYGLKIYALVDAQVFYLYNLEIYAGLQPEGQFRVSNKPTDIVLRLAKPLLGSGRNITADNWFSSIPLVEELAKQKLSFVGTLKKNKPEIPPSFICNKGRTEYSSLFGFQSGRSLVSYVPRKGKCVILVSSLHDDNSIDPDTGHKKKPTIITFYNQTKGGVDTTDKLCASYNVARNVRRWPMVVFFAMLNMSGINAQVIYFSNNNELTRRKSFLKRLSHDLVFPQIIRRSQQTLGMPLELQERLKRFRPCLAEINPVQSTERSEKRKRCEDCAGPTNKRRLTKYTCKSCKKAICLAHIEPFCAQCGANFNPPENDDVEME